MSILPVRRSIRNTNPIRPTFSLAGLPPFQPPVFAPTFVDSPADIPADLLDLSAAARAFELPNEEGGAGQVDVGDSDATPDADSASDTGEWPAAPASTPPADLPSPLGGPVPIPAREAFEATLDAWAAPHDDADPYHPTPADEAWHLAYKLESSGEPGSLPASALYDPAVFLRWAVGKRAAIEARRARVAREQAEQEAATLRAAYDAGCSAGYADLDLEPIAPHGMTVAQAREYLRGLDAGQEIRFRELSDAGEAWEEMGDCGRRVLAAIAEDLEDRREWAWLG